MQEILAENLQPLFDNKSLTGKKTYSGELYEVWEVSDEDFRLMCEIDEEEFERLCPEGMWRSADGSNIDKLACITYNVNGFQMLGWSCYSRNGHGYNGRASYSSLLEYLCSGIGASQPRNVCALAVDLAKYNGMTMGELFTKYEG